MSKQSRFAEIDTEISTTTAVVTRCTVCLWLSNPSTDRADAEFMRALLAQPVTAKGHLHVSRVFKAGGVQVGPDTVKRHRLAHAGQ